MVANFMATEGETSDNPRTCCLGLWLVVSGVGILDPLVKRRAASRARRRAVSARHLGSLPRPYCEADGGVRL